jgi:hypothetical protein
MPIMLFVDACCDVSLFVLLLQIYMTTNCLQVLCAFCSGREIATTAYNGSPSMILWTEGVQGQVRLI